MKAANKAVRMKDAEKGNEALRDMGYSEAQIKELREPDFCGRTHDLEEFALFLLGPLLLCGLQTLYPSLDPVDIGVIILEV